MTKEKQKNTKNNSRKSDQFEFCKVCKRNHNQGRRHNYFPSHAKSLSSFLSRFQTKLSDVRFFLKNPSLLRPEHASRSRLWCVFCDSDIDEVDNSFACGNAIKHLASLDHLKNLKSFLWKYGGGTDHLEFFRLSEADLAKVGGCGKGSPLDEWEKKCKSLKNEPSSEGSRGLLIGPSNDIHNELNSEYIDTFEKNNIHSLKSSFSNGVMPLQCYTDERNQVLPSELSEVTDVGPCLHDANQYVLVGTALHTNPRAVENLTGYMDCQHSLPYDCRKSLAEGYCNGRMYQVDQDGRKPDGEGSSQGLQALTQISYTAHGEGKGNVHSGAPPPWLDTTEGARLNVRLKPGLGVNTFASPLSKAGKSQNLNPKRVGAAWAERRKIELEMEKRGECVMNNFDANWLPNFGRVWQSGSRKESRKEFELENKNPKKAGSEFETSIKIQPYISKRMRGDAAE